VDVLSKQVNSSTVAEVDQTVEPMYGSRFASDPVPRFRLPEGELPARAAYQLIHDELSLDATPLLNLASFVTTWMEPEADRLVTEAAAKNFIDQHEYPMTFGIERRCVSIIADLFHAPHHDGEAVGTSTVGSSEAIHLAGLALRTNWRARRAAAGADDRRPNLVMSAAAHVTWEKFCRYFDVEARMLPVARDRFVLDPEQAVHACDERTIGVVGILGTTYTGHFDPIGDLDAALAALNERRGWSIPIHVDAASGGFVAPFAQPDLAWDFRLPTVASINVSGHKYGLVYPGVGWALWRTSADLPDELVFHDAYLGSDQATFDLNFSKGAGPIIGQYYNLVRLGRAGYARIIARAHDVAAFLADGITRDGRFDLISAPGGLPVVCARLVDESRFNAYDLARALRGYGWILPAYTMPPSAEQLTAIRVVVREGFTRDLSQSFLDHLRTSVDDLEKSPPAHPHPHHHNRLRVR
jgi:glutamate decarboxylase